MKSVDKPLVFINHQPQILNFQETNLKDNHSALIKNYTGCFTNRTFAQKASVEVAILIIS